MYLTLRLIVSIIANILKIQREIYQRQIIGKTFHIFKIYVFRVIPLLHKIKIYNSKLDKIKLSLNLVTVSILSYIADKK